MTADPRAVLYRPAPPPDHTVRWGDDPNQVADLRRPPAGGPPRPVVVVVHGGFWRVTYDRRHTDPLAADLATRGYPVAQLEYRRTGQPGGGWPGTFTDVVAGLAALPDLLQAAGMPHTGPPLLLGHSAGGQLALWAATAPQAGKVRGVVALAPVADLAAAHRLGLGDGAVAAVVGGGPAEVPQRYAELAALPPPEVPVVVLHGDQDQQVPVALGRDWVTSAQAAGCDVRLVELPGVDHFAVIDPQSGVWSRVTQVIAQLTE